MAPGNKNGWSQEQGGWVVNSVGFAGPRQRYTLAIMNALGDQGGYDDGVQTTTTLARILLSPQSCARRRALPGSATRNAPAGTARPASQAPPAKTLTGQRFG